MPQLRMQLKILLPSRVFGEIDDVTRIVAETRAGFVWHPATSARLRGGAGAQAF